MSHSITSRLTHGTDGSRVTHRRICNLSTVPNCQKLKMHSTSRQHQQKKTNVRSEFHWNHMVPFVANSIYGFVMSGERTAPRLEFNRHEILGTCPLLGHALLNSWDTPAPLGHALQNYWDMPALGTCPSKFLGQAVQCSAMLAHVRIVTTSNV